MPQGFAVDLFAQLVVQLQRRAHAADAVVAQLHTVVVEGQPHPVGGCNKRLGGRIAAHHLGAQLDARRQGCRVTVLLRKEQGFLDGLPSLYALKLYELHKLSDLSALSLSHLRYFAASLIADKLSAQALADAVMVIPDLEAAALQLVDRSERRYGGVQKAFAAAGKSPLLREEISALTTWLSL